MSQISKKSKARLNFIKEINDNKVADGFMAKQDRGFKNFSLKQMMEEKIRTKEMTAKTVIEYLQTRLDKKPGKKESTKLSALIAEFKKMNSRDA
jgi:hypothetical protein